jgi:hypothetical protein
MSYADLGIASGASSNYAGQSRLVAGDFQRQPGKHVASVTDRGLRLLALGLVCCGVATLLLRSSEAVDVPVRDASLDSGHAYSVHALAVPRASDLPGDDNLHPRRSGLQLLENGAPIGPAHSSHEDIRRMGGGRFSHWGTGLLFSSSDNSDPRINGRAYSVAFTTALPRWIGFLLLIAGTVALLVSDRRAWLRDLTDFAQRIGGHWVRIRSAAFPAWTLVHFALLASLIACSLILGFERSGWILMTQPVEFSHSTNSLLGYSFIRDGSVLHKENYSSFLQVAFFSGVDVTPDLYFRRPVYTFIATLFAPVFGVAAGLLLVNGLGWCLAAWLCYRFTLRFYGDPDAARWARAC